MILKFYLEKHDENESSSEVFVADLLCAPDADDFVDNFFDLPRTVQNAAYAFFNKDRKRAAGFAAAFKNGVGYKFSKYGKNDTIYEIDAGWASIKFCAETLNYVDDRAAFRQAEINILKALDLEFLTQLSFFALLNMPNCPDKFYVIGGGSDISLIIDRGNWFLGFKSVAEFALFLSDDNNFKGQK